MADTDSVRIEVGFDGGQIMSALERIGAVDGRYTIVLRRVVYLKRFARESRVGFGL